MEQLDSNSFVDVEHSTPEAVVLGFKADSCRDVADFNVGQVRLSKGHRGIVPVRRTHAGQAVVVCADRPSSEEYGL